MIMTSLFFGTLGTVLFVPWDTGDGPKCPKETRCISLKWQK